MCGICGVYQYGNQEVNKSLLSKMTKEMFHRGPDDEGYALWSSPDDTIRSFSGDDTTKDLDFPHIMSDSRQYKVGFGFRRLSILDLTSHGHQPMIDDRMNTMLVFNGEIYNYLEIKDELLDLGYVFHSKTDSEVVLNSYLEWGESCVKRFNGMWSFCIYDKIKGQIFASRDRFGIKPFYYYNDSNKFVFASEIKQILLDQDIDRIVEDDVLVEYLRSGTKDNSHKTFFRGIFQLEPGHNLVISQNNNFTIKKYWESSVNPTFGKKDGDRVVENKFYNLFRRSVEIRHRSDVPVGIALSGGIDSSSTAVVANTLSDNEFKTFTMVFDNLKFDEREFAREAANNIRSQRFEYEPTAEGFLREEKEFIYHFEEPFRSLSTYSQWCLMRLVKSNDVTVLLEGQGADELLGGYEWYFDSYFNNLLLTGKLKKLFTEISCFCNNYNQNRSVVLIRILKNVIKGFRKKSTANTVLNKQFVNDDIASPSINSLSDNLTFGIQKLIRELLNNGDKNSMKFSVENRVPFLDIDLVEYITKLPLHYKMNNGSTKEILRNSLKGLLPDKIRKRYSKLGFATPQEVWQRTSLADHMKSELLNDDVLKMKYFKSDKLEQYILDYYAEKHNDYGFIWRCYNFVVWKRIYNVSITN
jgi:asparagine synthase (glutamine-hydrolysing)